MTEDIVGVITKEALDPAMADARLASLLEAVRLKTIRTLIVEPAAACNLNCAFCDMHSGRLKNVDHLKGIMSFETFQTAIDQLRDAGIVLKQLQYIGNGDPLLNKNIAQFVAYAKEKGVAETQRLITNGVAMTEDNFLAIVKAGIDVIDVSLDAIDRERYKSIKGKDFLELVLKNIKFAADYIIQNNVCQLAIKCALPHENGRYGVVGDDVRGIVDYFASVTAKTWRITIRGVPLVAIMDAWQEKGREFTTPCEVPFYSLTLRFDGSVIACCSDILMTLKLGEIQKTTIGDIIRGEKLRAIRLCHLNGDFKTIPLCRYCENRPVTDLTGVVDQLRDII